MPQPSLEPVLLVILSCKIFSAVRRKYPPLTIKHQETLKQKSFTSLQFSTIRLRCENRWLTSCRNDLIGSEACSLGVATGAGDRCLAIFSTSWPIWVTCEVNACWLFISWLSVWWCCPSTFPWLEIASWTGSGFAGSMLARSYCHNRTGKDPKQTQRKRWCI